MRRKRKCGKPTNNCTVGSGTIGEVKNPKARQPMKAKLRFPFVCGLCEASFNNIDTFHHHFNKHSNEISHKSFHRCNDKGFIRNKTLLNVDSYNCSACCHTFPTICQLHDHIGADRNESSYVVDIKKQTGVPQSGTCLENKRMILCKVRLDRNEIIIGNKNRKSKKNKCSLPVTNVISIAEELDKFAIPKYVDVVDSECDDEDNEDYDNISSGGMEEMKYFVPDLLKCDGMRIIGSDKNGSSNDIGMTKNAVYGCINTQDQMKLEVTETVQEDVTLQNYKSLGSKSENVEDINTNFITDHLTTKQYKSIDGSNAHIVVKTVNEARFESIPVGDETVRDSYRHPSRRGLRHTGTRKSYNIDEELSILDDDGPAVDVDIDTLLASEDISYKPSKSIMKKIIKGNTLSDISDYSDYNDDDYFYDALIESKDVDKVIDESELMNVDGSVSDSINQEPKPKKPRVILDKECTATYDQIEGAPSSTEYDRNRLYKVQFGLLTYQSGYRIMVICKLCDKKLERKKYVCHVQRTHKDQETFKTEELQQHLNEVKEYLKNEKEERKKMGIKIGRPKTIFVEPDSDYDESGEKKEWKLKKCPWQGKRTKCGVCGLLIGRRLLKDHLEIHKTEEGKQKFSPQNLQTCGLCGRVVWRYNFSKHRCPNPEKESYIYQYQKSYVNKWANDTVACHICGFTMKRKQLSGHIARHNKPKEDTPCEHCGDIFRHRGTLQRHIRNMHTEPIKEEESKHYMCDQCPMVFKTEKGLETHGLRHSGEKPFSCDLCPAKYASRNALFAHNLRRHEKQKFECPECSRRYYHRYYLDLHVQSVHRNVKEFVCTWNKCGDLFSTCKSLRRHMCIHTGEKPAKCNMCNAAYIQRTQLKTHMMRAHNTDILPPLSQKDLFEATVATFVCTKSDGKLMKTITTNFAGEQIPSALLGNIETELAAETDSPSKLLGNTETELATKRDSSSELPVNFETELVTKTDSLSELPVNFETVLVTKTDSLSELPGNFETVLATKGDSPSELLGNIKTELATKGYSPSDEDEPDLMEDSSDTCMNDNNPNDISAG